MSANDLPSSGAALKRLSGLFFNFLYQYFSHHPKRKITIVASVMLGIVLMLGWQFNMTVKDVVTDEFNQQQLVLARSTAEQISRHFWMLKKELTLLSLSPAMQEPDRSALARRLETAYASLRGEGVIAIQFLDPRAQTTYVIDDIGFRKGQASPESSALMSWAQDEANRGNFHIGEVYASSGDADLNHMQMKMAIPVWKDVAGSSEPETARFSGALVFVIGVTSTVQERTDRIKSGKSGYAWVIDSNGIFLFHHEPGLIGKNAFEARKEKKPTISFARINEIQKKMMLAGKEGASWYISGWHRGTEGTIRKLIAYSPIVLDDSPEKKIWSVAVVAPVSEVEEAIHNIQIRQFLLQFVIIGIILFSALFIISIMVTWSASLKREVAVQTTEHKKSEQKYRSLIENAEDLIFTIDREGKILSINTYGSVFLGRTTDQIVNHTIAEIFSWPTAEMLLTTIREVFSIKQGRQVTHLVSVNDQDFWLNTNFRRLLDEEGNIYAVLGIARDITHRKQMEQQSYYTEKLASMGTLAAGVAHEINNPLAIILGFTDMLIEKVEPGTEMHSILNTIYAQGNKAKKVVDNLLSFARTKEHTEVDVDINRNIEEVLSVMANSLLVSKISIQTMNLFSELPPVKGDPDELQQVFFNIINNAAYAMKGGGSLSISTRAIDDGRRIEIRFSDTGPGIRREYRKRIFDPLFTTKKVGDGTGLGLSVSYGIITRHRGTLSFETKSKDESDITGTTFIITLPAATAPSAQEPIS